VSLTKSEQMSRVRNRDTGPELYLRRLLSALGVRYRLHRGDLPGHPDIFVGRLNLAIFVNGCFWHGHLCARAARPKTNSDFWNKKLDANVSRDRHVREKLQELNISCMTLWTCELDVFAERCKVIARDYLYAKRNS
jgi:DNA mismatch endonuclease (patch repair protein)